MKTLHLEEQTISRGLQAYYAIRQAIQEGQLLAGTRLREVELAKNLDLSLTPIREALSRLENDPPTFYVNSHYL